MMFFPDPYPDEILYSTFARYHFYSGNKSYRDTLEELFGSGNIMPSVLFPSKIESVSRRIKNGKYLPDYLIQNHTLFPLYIQLQTFEKRQNLIKAIKHGDSEGLYASLGVAAGSICSKKHLYYCPVCVEEEVSNYNEAYFKRTHQIQGVFVCHIHRCLLREYPVDYRKYSRIGFIRLDHKVISNRVAYNIELPKDTDHFRISQAANYFLNHPLEEVSLEIIKQKYKELLYDRGLAKHSGQVNQLKLYEQFIDYYGSDFLKSLESFPQKDNGYCWLKVITRKITRAIHPIRHILLILFLSNNVEEFLNYKKKQEPFGRGPWICLNPVAFHYKQPVISNVNITEDTKTKEPVGTFNCSCGFIYSRRGPDTSPQDIYKIGTIKAFGGSWENTLEKKLSQKTWSLRELAREMKCDPKTIKKYSQKLNKSLDDSVIINKTEKLKKGDCYTKSLICYLELNPDCSRTQIRKKFNREYAWLYRNDKPLLEKVLPSSKKSPTKKYNRVDWVQRDFEIGHDVKKALSEIKQLEDHERITLALIGRAIEKEDLLRKYKQKLPYTMRVVSSELETIEDYQIRRIGNISKKLYKEKGKLRKWEILKEAGLDQKKLSIRIVNEIEMVLEATKA